MMVSLGINLGVLLWFKYFNFFLTSAGAFLAWAGLPVSIHTLAIILPYGVSFYTFQSMSYTIEVYRRHIDARTQFPRPGLLHLLFPAVGRRPDRPLDDLPPPDQGKAPLG